jgi:hypothetical protein
MKKINKKYIVSFAIFIFLWRSSKLSSVPRIVLQNVHEHSSSQDSFTPPVFLGKERIPNQYIYIYIYISTDGKNLRLQ